MTDAELAIFAAAFERELAARAADAPEAADATGPAGEALAAGAAIEASLATENVLSAAAAALRRIEKMDVGEGIDELVLNRAEKRLRVLLGLLG